MGSLGMMRLVYNTQKKFVCSGVQLFFILVFTVAHL